MLVSQLAALLSRAGLVFAEDRPGLFAGDAGTASPLHVDRKPLLQFCALEQKVADGLGKKWIFWDNVNIYHAISIHILNLDLYSGVDIS